MFVSYCCQYENESSEKDPLPEQLVKTRIGSHLDFIRILWGAPLSKAGGDWTCVNRFYSFKAMKFRGSTGEPPKAFVSRGCLLGAGGGCLKKWYSPFVILSLYPFFLKSLFLINLPSGNHDFTFPTSASLLAICPEERIWKLQHKWLIFNILPHFNWHSF